MSKYYVKFPDWCGPVSVYGNNVKDALQSFKRIHGVERMPKGYKIFKASVHPIFGEL